MQEQKKREYPWWAPPVIGGIVRAVIAFLLDQWFREGEGPS